MWWITYILTAQVLISKVLMLQWVAVVMSQVCYCISAVRVCVVTPCTPGAQVCWRREEVWQWYHGFLLCGKSTSEWKYTSACSPPSQELLGSSFLVRKVLTEGFWSCLLWDLPAWPHLNQELLQHFFFFYLKWKVFVWFSVGFAWTPKSQSWESLSSWSQY